MTDEDEDLPEAKPYARYEWDCPECSDVNDAGDIEPSGVEVCEYCGSRVMVKS